MSARQNWEYAQLVYFAEGKRERVSKVRGAEFAWVYYQYFYLHLPGEEEPRQLEHWRSTERNVQHHSVFSLLNELGAEGWEAVSDTVLSSGLNLHTPGWANASEPIRRSITLKRPAV